MTRLNTRLPMPVETLGEACSQGWRVTVRCADGRTESPRSQSSRECSYRRQLDMETLVWTRGLAVRRQHVLDRISGVRKGGFLAHRSQSRSEDETEIRDGKDALRTNHQRHSAGDAEALFG